MTSNQEEEKGSGCGWIVMTALLAFGALYQYNQSNSHPPEDLSETSVVLQTPPFYGSSNHGDAGTHFFLEFELTDYKEFTLRGCRYSATNDSITKLLAAGDTLVIRTEGHLTQETDDNIYSIISPRYGTMLAYTGVTACDLDNARMFTLMGIGCIVLGVCWLWKRRTEERRILESEETDPEWAEFVQQYQQVLAGTMNIAQFANKARELSGIHQNRLNTLLGDEYDRRNYDGLNILIIAARRSPSRAYTTTLCLIVDANVASITTESVVDLLCHLGDPTSVPTLARAAKTHWSFDERVHLNKKCVRTLGLINTKESIWALRDLTQDAPNEISAEAQQELNRINNA